MAGLKAKKRVVIVSIDDTLYAPAALGPIFSSTGFEVPLLVTIPVLRARDMHPKGVTGARAGYRRLRYYGFLESYRFLWSSLRARGASLSALAAQYHVQHLSWTGSVNDPGLIEYISRLSPSIVLGIFSEKAGPSLIRASSGGLLLLHYSLLPDGAGREPVFWTLLKRPENGGITWFLATDELDGGPVVKQVHRDLSSMASLHEAIRDLSEQAGSCVEEAVRIAAGSEPLKPGEKPPSRYAWPTTADVASFRSRGLRFI